MGWAFSFAGYFSAVVVDTTMIDFCNDGSLTSVDDSAEALTMASGFRRLLNVGEF